MTDSSRKIGVLALQGDFLEHVQTLRRPRGRAGRSPAAGGSAGPGRVDHPRGREHTIGKLAISYGLMEPLREFGRSRALWGTCAGMVLMAREIGQDQPLLGLMDIKVQRNAFGRQKESFRADIRVPVLPEGDTRPFPAVFIRAPKLVAARGAAKIIASLADGTAVAVREGKWLATAFHPELTDDDRFHRYFLGMAV